MERKRRKKDAYHHGDLRAALVAAGLALLERDGLEGLTLRRIAAKAGVSHAAPAHHFPTLTALLTALAVVGFERFAAAMIAERNTANKDPGAQMAAAGQGYVKFAVANPGLFRLMFSKTLLHWEDATLKETARASFRQLEEIVQPMLGGTDITGDPIELMKLVWCSVHGYAHLLLEGQMQLLEGDKPGMPKPPDIGGLLSHMRPTRGR